MADRDKGEDITPSLVARFLNLPLVQFFAIGASIFAIYGLVNSGNTDTPMERDRIVVSDGRVEQLARVFEKTWQRPPTASELKGLLDSYIKEEVYYREALKLALDRDDTVIRRRMQQKMEFLTEPWGTVLSPSDAELAAYLEKNRASFRIEPKVAFEQIFLRLTDDAETPEQRVDALLRDLRAGGANTDHRNLGDPTLLPSEVALSPLDMIARSFGEDFTKRLIDLPVGSWQGPVASTYGVHLVRILERREAEVPSLSQVREAVVLRWRAEKRDAYMRDRYEELLSGYDIILPDLSEQGVRSMSAKP